MGLVSKRCSDLLDRASAGGVWCERAGAYPTWAFCTGAIAGASGDQISDLYLVSERLKTDPEASEPNWHMSAGRYLEDGRGASHPEARRWSASAAEAFLSEPIS